MNHRLPNYIRAHRKRWTLTQEELATLLGLTTQAAVSQYEGTGKRPGIEILIAAKTIFNVSCREMFPRVYDEIEGELLARAQALHKRIEGRGDVSAATKLKFLAELIQRIENKSSDL